MQTVEFHFDFGSPNAYLSHLVIPEIERRTGARFEYVPVLLGGVFKLTGNASPMVTQAGVRNKPEYEQREMQRFIQHHQLQERFRMNPHFPVNTLQIMRGAVAALQIAPALYSRYIDAIFAAMWCEPRKLDDPAEIEQVLEAAGLPAADLVAGVQQPEVKAALLANTERSVELGAFGSPSFFVGEELFFGKDRLRDVEELLLSGDKTAG